MSAPRRFLPPLTALRALEALDRLGSVTAAAREMNLTQSAVSRQLQTLEAQLGATLLARRGRGVSLTPEARLYATEVRAALTQIAHAGMRLRMAPAGAGTVTLAILPSFGMRWLVPRLPEFARRHPDVTVNLTSRLSRVDFTRDEADAAIHFGTGDLPDCHSLRLRGERVIAVAAPALMAEAAPQAPSDLLRLPLLHIQTRPEAWRDWFARHGLATVQAPGMVYDQFTTITQAALHGLGVALLPEYLAEQDLATGRLVPVWGGAQPSPGAYHLVWPRDRSPGPGLVALRDWLATQAEDGDSLPR